jgi:YegS/Rv2252/BmrU family lipid kinase
MQKILFIVNPIAGSGRKKNIPELINDYIDKNTFKYEIRFWEKWDDVSSLVKKGIEENFDIFAAIGGDGTVNEVAKSIIGTNKILAIIPSGSGNGIARHLKIPINTKRAIAIINKFKPTRHDTAQINNTPFLMCAGCGFDAHVAHLFSKSKKRGFQSYIKIIVQEFAHYKPQKFNINIDGKEFTKEAFLISVANCSQFGNNAWIAPEANSADGLLNITLIQPFLPIKAPALVQRLFLKTIHQSKYVETYTGKHIRINQEHTIAQYDGEAFEAGQNIDIHIQPSSLSILTN